MLILELLLTRMVNVTQSVIYGSRDAEEGGEKMN